MATILDFCTILNSHNPDSRLKQEVFYQTTAPSFMLFKRGTQFARCYARFIGLIPIRIQKGQVLVIDDDAHYYDDDDIG
jgi:hypothetical protein